VKSRDSITNFELGDFVANGMNDTADVITLIEHSLVPYRSLPILGVAPTHNNLDNELPRICDLRHWGIMDRY
jgi:hypothetical protein